MAELTLDMGLAYASLLVMALIPIYLGSHYSLKQKGVESMSSRDAYMFPFIGSAVLFGLYLLFRLFHKDYINLLLSGYFLLFGILALGTTLRPVFELLFPKLVRKKNPIRFSFVPFWNKTAEPVKIKFDEVDIISVAFATLIGVWYILHKHWVANNILGLAFAIQGISLLSLGSYKVGCILLSGLFFYDIFWVFGTEVMVTVAKSFDAPVKLLFPKNIFADQLQFSMLGLGDIVIPGIFIALLLRFDAKFSAKRKQGFSKTYFSATFVGYVLGLATTIFVMHTFQAAQPALLYLVPFCIGTSLVTALHQSQLYVLLSYNEEKEKKDTSPKSDKSDNSDKEDKKESKDEAPSVVENKKNGESERVKKTGKKVKINAEKK
jgi:minor histocompatibility antigen H13